MPWWILEVGTTLVLVAIAVWLGPFIKRFGRAYAADVFHDNPLTGKSYIVLTDIVYYLIFTAYILLTVQLRARATTGTTVHRSGHRRAAPVGGVRIGGILLIIGAPARPQHRAHAGARAALLAQPEAVGRAARPGPLRYP